MVILLTCVQGKVRMLAGAKCGYMPLAAPPGRLAFMSLGDEELELYFAKHPRNYEVGGAGFGDFLGQGLCLGKQNLKRDSAKRPLL